jgi:Hydrazine synthase alpha subunit middle domain
MNVQVGRIAYGLLAIFLATVLSACSGGGSFNIANSQAADPSTQDYPIFYVKRTIPTTANIADGADDVRMLRVAFPSADLYMRASAAPDAVETNITSRITAAANTSSSSTGTTAAAATTTAATTPVWDVKDVDVSADGTMVIFAMRGPLTANMEQKNAPSWRIYQYTIATDTLAPVISPANDPDPPTVNDVSPHYLPDGRIVFSSTRQTESQGVLLNEGFPQFVYQDEANTEPAFVLEVMNADGTGVHQISFNQSDDQEATVLQSGRVLWTRWDNAPGGTNAMHLYSSNPDGTDTELYYGANSHMTGTNDTVIEFMRPREMQTGGILSLVRQFSDVDFGGNLIIINGTEYVENTQPLLAYAGQTGPAQTPATTNDVVTIPGPSPGGRFSSAFPLWDGTNRILVTWEQCRLLSTAGAIVPCTTSALADPTAQTAPPLYSVWIFDPSSNTLLPVMQPVEGVMVADVVAAQPRTLQNIILDQVPGVTLNQDLVTAGVGVIDIKSVYDFDGVDTAVPNIQTVANTAKTPVSQRTARFVRIEQAVSQPNMDVVNLAQAAFGASNFMRDIVGYAPVEPDGSVDIQVPADVAFTIEVLDANGRNISPGLNVWLQAIPGEVVTCNGCHKTPTPQTPYSHGRSGVFAAAYAGASTAGVPFPGTLAAPATVDNGTVTLEPFIPNAGETMAEARARITCALGSQTACSQVPSVNVLYTDVWTDPAQATPGAAITLSYNDLVSPEAIPTTTNCASAWASGCLIIINYPEHIQPIWDLPRPAATGATSATTPYTCNQAGGCTCTQGGCHTTTGATAATQAPAGQLNLTNTPASDQPLQFVSYRQLLFQHNEQIDTMGDLQNLTVPGGATVPVGPYLNAGSANGGLSATFLNRFAAGSGSTHAGWLSPAELRLLSEWLDIGAQYFNNPFDPAVPVN